MCNGWWSPWCVIDVVTNARVPWFRRMHERSLLIREYRFWSDESLALAEEAWPSAAAGWPDWAADSSMPAAEKLRRFEALGPEPTVGPNHEEAP